jgi:hypothetical protein
LTEEREKLIPGDSWKDDNNILKLPYLLAFLKLVRARGLEPLILSEPDPKSGASASSATRAYHRSINTPTLWIIATMQFGLERAFWQDAWP